jgi:6-phosphogluconolactonase
MSTAVIVCGDAEQIAQRALDLLVSQLGLAIRMRGAAHVALTGGSSASALFGLLRSDPRARRVEWDGVHAWPGDERFVPLADPASNWGLALREWLAHPDGPALAAGQLHPVPVDEALAAGDEPDAAAARYDAMLTAALPSRDGVPAFDVILLGLGSDGHILSAFPGEACLVASAGAATAVAAPTHIGPHLPRITIMPRLLAAAGLVIVMVPGSAKRDIIERCFGSPFDPWQLPAQLAIRPNAVWLLDRACAPVGRLDATDATDATDTTGGMLVSSTIG